MKNFLLERLSSEPDKNVASKTGDGTTEYIEESINLKDSSGLISGKTGETPKRYYNHPSCQGKRGVDNFAPAPMFYIGGRGIPPSENIVCGKAQQTNRIFELYDEYKIVFKSRLLGKVENIVVEMMEINRESPLIHLIHGEMFLYRGNAEKSHYHLSRYIENTKEPDSYAIFVIATWNDFTNHKNLAFKQYTACLDHLFDISNVSRALFSLSCIKKKLKFLDTSISYFNRLLAVPEGFHLLPCIQLEIIHTHVLKRNRAAAIDAIRKMSRHVSCSFVKRLRAYLDYTEKNYEAILKYRDGSMMDPYIFYLMGRIGSEMTISDIDVSHCFDESLRNSSGSPIIYNSYGNHYFRIGRYSDAAIQYKNALTLNPNFQPALDNMKLLDKASDIVYTANISVEMPFLSEVDPDVEEMGFLFVWTLLGYTQFKGDFSFLGPLNVALPSIQ